MNISFNSKEKEYWNIKGDKSILVSLYNWLKESHNTGMIISVYKSKNTFVIIRDKQLKESNIEKLKKGELQKDNV